MPQRHAGWTFNDRLALYLLEWLLLGHIHVTKCTLLEVELQIRHVRLAWGCTLPSSGRMRPVGRLTVGNGQDVPESVRCQESKWRGGERDCPVHVDWRIA